MVNPKKANSETVFSYPRVQIQLDLFHAQNLYPGNITDLIKLLCSKNMLGHVQASQVPHRGGLKTLGELNFEYIFQVLNEEGYQGYVGLEHKGC